jgi:hypothetical protein
MVMLLFINDADKKGLNDSGDYSISHAWRMVRLILGVSAGLYTRN